MEEDLTLDDSTLALDGKPPPAPGGSSVVDVGGKGLEDDELVLGGSGKGSDVTIGGDSGISLVDPSDSGLSLETPLNLGARGRGVARIRRGRHAHHQRNGRRGCRRPN